MLIIHLYLQFPRQDCSVTPRLGQASHSLLLPNGGRCETDNHNAIQALAHRQESQGSRIVNTLERRWLLSLGCTTALIGCVWLFISSGIPFLAEKLAYRLPMEINDAVTRRVASIMDKSYFEPTQLDEEVQATARVLFEKVVSEYPSQFNLQLEFRHSPQIGANAFALPSGLIVVTDDLIDLVDRDKELIGILVHERAHIENRHGMRSVLQSSGVFFLVSALVGDIASITSTAATLPSLLLETGYSRKFEREADEAVGNYFIAKGWSTAPYQDALNRLAENSPHLEGLSLLSNHPLTEERIKLMQQFEAVNKGNIDQ